MFRRGFKTWAEEIALRIRRPARPTTLSLWQHRLAPTLFRPKRRSLLKPRAEKSFTNGAVLQFGQHPHQPPKGLPMPLVWDTSARLDVR
jgi:hypothetical protein